MPIASSGCVTNASASAVSFFPAAISSLRSSSHVPDAVHEASSSCTAAANQDLDSGERSSSRARSSRHHTASCTSHAPRASCAMASGQPQKGQFAQFACRFVW
eukprot:1158767-Rhodomonas_salina.2